MNVTALVPDLLDRSRFPDGVRALRAAGSTARVVAYGRHTEVELLAEARAAGCDRVLARSAFFADVERALAH